MVTKDGKPPSSASTSSTSVKVADTTSAETSNATETTETIKIVTSATASTSATTMPVQLAAEVLDPAQGLQVVTVTSKQTYLLDEVALTRILMRDDIKDLPVVVVSVAGAFRGGKSFMLNFFLRYLNAPLHARTDSGEWLGDENTPLTGFSWRGGTARHTTGILIWSNPIVCDLPSGEKVAVLLMDTQGTFDNRSSIRDSSTIFAIATLLSSVQIYNISGNIKEDALQHLQFFTEYGRLINNADGGKAFQGLLFLIRDWDFEYEYPFGRTGGEQVLENSLQITDDQPKELRDLRKHIRSCFETISCFLMPHPGRNIRKPTFDGRLSDLDQEFKTALLDLIPSIFSSSMLVPKMINGVRVRARDFVTYFQSYMKIFNSDKIPSPMTIMKATSEAAMLSAVREARALYESIMDDNCGPKKPSWPKNALREMHSFAASEARNSFATKKKMGSEKDSQPYAAQLNQELDARLTEFLMMNEHKVAKAIAESKDKYEAYVNDVNRKDMLCLHPNDLENIHREGVSEAATVFDSNRKQDFTVKDEERAIFLESFNKDLELLRSINDVNNRLVVSEIRTTYSTTMSNLCAQDPPLDENEFLEEHKAAFANAIATLDNKRNRASSYDEDLYKTDMSQKILEFYTKMSFINRSKNKKALQQSLHSYDNYMIAFWDTTTCCLHPEDLRLAHEAGKSQALRMFHPNQESHELDYEKMLLSQIMDFKYRDLTDLNKSGNQAAVTAAYNKYYKAMEADCAPTGWWILVIPMVVQRAKKSTYHKKNKKEAIELFQSKRRSTTTEADDPYLEDLERRIKASYQKF